MALIDPPELRRLRDFWEALPHCPRGCDNSGVYESPSFRTPEDTIDDQVSEIIARYERDADAQLRQHLAEHDSVFAFVEQAYRVAEADRAAAWERIRWDADAIAERLTETMVPAALRALGMRFEWAEGE